MNEGERSSNGAVEIHDSTLAAIDSIGGDLILRLSPAYIHRSAGRPGWDPGSGWVQEVDLIFKDAVVASRPSQLPIDLHDGSLCVGGVPLDGLIPMPMEFPERVTFAASTIEGTHLIIRGSGMKVIPIGVARYVEEFPGSADG